VVQELWELFQLSMEDPILPETSKLCMVISQAAITSQKTPKTLKLLGCIQSSQIVILVDSGSTHIFISATLASKLTSGSSVLASLTVQVADGNKLVCQTEFVDMQWSVQSYTFSSNLKVLPLQHYDMIVGMDWLERFSTMQVHWAQKWLMIPYNNSVIRLQGELPIDYEVTMVELSAISQDSDQLELYPPIHDLLDTYSSVFSEPQGLPPYRACDHAIPLIQGA